MATTAYGVNHPLAVKLWAKKLYRDTLKETWAMKFMGKTSNSLIMVQDDLKKGPGDRIRMGLRMQLTGRGVIGDATLEGQEEALSTYYDDLFIDQQRHAVRSSGKMSEQRVSFEVREEAYMGLKDWFADRIDTSLANQLAGNTAEADTAYTGNNATIAPSSNRMIVATSAGTEGSLSASSTFRITHLDNALVLAKTASPYIRPIKYKGGDYYVAFLHPYQVFNLRTDASANKVTWYDTQKAALAGGAGEESNIFTGALGTYNGVVLHEWTRVPNVPSNANARRAIFCGAQAATMAYGQSSDAEKPSWVEEFFDYQNQLGVAASTIWGAKKSSFAVNGTATDFGVITISTWAATPNVDTGA